MIYEVKTRTKSDVRMDERTYKQSIRVTKCGDHASLTISVLDKNDLLNFKPRIFHFKHSLAFNINNLKTKSLFRIFTQG